MHLRDERTVQRFWQEHACGDAQVGGLRERFHDDYERFFTDYDRFRYQNERHLPGESLMGWHLRAHLEPVIDSDQPATAVQGPGTGW